MTAISDEQYRKDKKKLIGVGLLICAFFIFLLHSWNMGRLAEIRAERERIEMERRAKDIVEKPMIPGFRDLFDIDRVISPEMMDKIIREIGKNEIYDKEKEFANFKMTISSEWQEVKREELKEVFPGIIHNVDKANAEILFLAHNFDINRVVIDMLKRGDVGMLGKLKIDLQKIKFQEIMLFNIIKFRELEKVDDFVNFIKEFDKKSEYFKIIDKNIVKRDENEIKIATKFSFSQRIEDRIQEIKIYSYKKIVLIDKDIYAFIFLRDSELTKENIKEIDKILESVIIN